MMSQPPQSPQIAANDQAASPATSSPTTASEASPPPVTASATDDVKAAKVNPNPTPTSWEAGETPYANGPYADMPPPAEEPPPWVKREWMTDDEAKDDLNKIYLWYLGGFVLGFPALVGFLKILNHYMHGTKTPLLRSHCVFLVRTLCGVILIAVVGFFIGLLWKPLGVPLWIGGYFWALLRCLLGYRRAQREQAIENPETFGVPH